MSQRSNDAAGTIANVYQLTPETRAAIIYDLHQAANALASMYEIALRLDSDNYAHQSLALEAMAQKAGYLVDRCLPRLGETIYSVGGADEWFSLSRNGGE
jgi:hypothetical protein